MPDTPVRASTWAAEAPLTLGDLAAAIGRRWWWVLGAFVASSVFAAMWAFSMPATYRATVVVVPAGVEKELRGAGAFIGQSGGAGVLGGIGLDSQDLATEEALAVLKSRDFGERFITDHGLLPVLFPKDWDAARNQWLPGREPTLAQGFRRFDEDIRSASRDKRTGLVYVSITWTNPTQAAAWANEIVARINADMRARAVKAASASLAFLEKERGRVPFLETRQTIDRLIEAQISRSMVASVTPQYVFRVVDRALPPDPEFPVGPTRNFILVAGPLFGLLLGCALALLHAGILGEFSSSRARRSRATAGG
jgi:uncharacterized protein involved in exopolysaccharide biosynthesis